MKKLMESLDRIEECGMDEGPMPGAMPPAPMDQGDPVRMNVNISAAGKDHVADLIDMMKNAGMKDAEPVSAKMLSPRMDMERLAGIMNGPKEELGEDDDPEMMDKLQKIADGPDGEDELLMRMEHGMGEEGMYLRKTYDKVSNKMFSKDSGDLEDPEDFDKVHAEVMQMFGIKAEPLASLQQKAQDRTTSDALNDPELTGTEKEGYENEPDPEYGDMSDAIPDGNDLHKRKKSFKATAGGDNPMNTESIKAQLMAALQEKKGKPDFLDLDKDGNKKEPMKKAAKDAGKGKGSKPKKGEVPPQFKKK